MSRRLWAAVALIASLSVSANALRADAPSVVPSPALRANKLLEALNASNTRTTIRIDASRGVQVWAPVHAEVVFRVNGEPFTRALIEANTKKDDFDRVIRQSFFDLLPSAERSFASVNDVSWAVDDTGALHIIMDGQTKPIWQKRPSGGRGHDIESSKIDLLSGYARPNESSNAPFGLKSANAEWWVTVLLPKDGKGITVVGDDIDRQIGGREIRRATTVSGGTLSMRASVRPLVSEITYADAKAAEPVLKQLSESAVTLIADEGLFAEQARQSDILAAESFSAEDAFDKARILLVQRQPALALASIDQALAAGMQGAIVYVVKGDALVALERRADARLAYEQGLQRGPNAPVNQLIQLGLARIDIVDGRPKDAVARMDALLAETPRDTILLMTRAMARVALNDRRGALADTDAALAINPSNIELVRLRSRLANGG